MGMSIEPEMTIFEVTERFPQTIRIFVDAGFPKVLDPDKRRAIGKSLTIKNAARLRKLDQQELIHRLTQAVQTDGTRQDVTLAEPNEMTLLPRGDVRISGLLPCPVRIPILEAVQELARQQRQKSGLELGWSLGAASVGADQLNNQIALIDGEADLPEIFISAGFESFFDQRNLKRFSDRGVFIDVAPRGINACFSGLDLRDPSGSFTMLAVVPAVFLVNESLLDGDAAPRTWEALLHPRFEGRISLPVGDFDLFNGILLNLYKRFGEQGVRALSRNMLTSLHPSQAVGRFSSRQPQQPAISIIPYFFSKMTLKSKVIHTLWPEDGAIICPIFMLVKRSALLRAGPAADLFLSEEVGQILAHKGFFPVLDPRVDNRLPAGSRFIWLGWDTIQEHDLGELIPRLNDLFAGSGGAWA
jgi:hypothetical protein